MNECPVTLAGEPVILSADRFLAWQNTVFLADIHFGKDAMLRSSHHWTPPGSTGANLHRLDSILSRRAARRLVILGDLFHSRHAEEAIPAIRQWREAHAACEILVIPGNHDRRTESLAEACGFASAAEGSRLGPWTLRHHPPGPRQGFTLCGHVHPQALFRGPGRQRLRLPCFVISRTLCTLPAFGDFTGGQVVRPRPGERVFALADGQIVPYAHTRMSGCVRSDGSDGSDTSDGS